QNNIVPIFPSLVLLWKDLTAALFQLTSLFVYMKDFLLSKLIDVEQSTFVKRIFPHGLFVPLSLPLKFPVIKSSRPDESFHQLSIYPPFEQWEHLIVAIFVIKHIVFLHHCFSLLFENLPLALHFSRYSFAAKVASFLRFLFENW